MSLTDLGIVLDDSRLREFQDQIIANSAIGQTHGQRIRAAISRVR